MAWGGRTGSTSWSERRKREELRTGDGLRCLTAEPCATQGSRLTTEPCDGRAEQKWTHDGVTIAAAAKPDQCVHVLDGATANDAVVGLWPCGTGADGKWRRP